jgi:hypothetical protein
MALIPVFVFALLCMAVLIVGVAISILIAFIAFLAAHPRIRAVVLPILAVVLVVVGAFAGRRALEAMGWQPLANKLAPLARNENPLKEKLSPFIIYAPYANGFERYLPLTSDQRWIGAMDTIDRLNGVPDHQQRPNVRGSRNYDYTFAFNRKITEIRNVLDKDDTLIAMQGAGLTIALRSFDSRNDSFESIDKNTDVLLAEEFLARLSRDGNRDASRDLALLISKQQPREPDLYGESYCKTTIRGLFHFEDTDCDRYDPNKGSGIFGFFYRTYIGRVRSGISNKKPSWF